MYSIWVNPSARSSASATYCGARQMHGTLVSRIRVVSGGGSATATPALLNPRAKAPAASAFRESRLDALILRPAAGPGRTKQIAPTPDPLGYVFISRLSSSRNRQSVP